MKKTGQFVVLGLVAGLLFFPTRASADTVNGLTVRTGTDLVNWAQLQPSGCMTSVPQGTGFTSTGGIGGTINFAGGPGKIRQQASLMCGDWFGNFAPGDNVLWTNSPGQGPLTLAFNQGLSIVGAQIQADITGSFTAKVCDQMGDCFSENGTSNTLANNSAIFIGLKDLTGPNITALTFSLTSCALDCFDFGINQLSLTSGAPVPEPGTLLLLGCGLLALLAGLRRRLLAQERVRELS